MLIAMTMSHARKSIAMRHLAAFIRFLLLALPAQLMPSATMEILAPQIRA
jgi:hypothetical protein